MILEPVIARKYERLKSHFDERTRRLWAAAEAEVLGGGGVSAVHRATGLARSTIEQGLRDLAGADRHWPAASKVATRVRAPGGGRKRTTATDATLLADLESLVSPATRGDPMSPLRWTCKSLRKLTEELRALGHSTSHRMVAEMLRSLGYSLQANVKTKEGGGHEHRDAQFQHISARVQEMQAARQPVISVDTKKKELVGDFKNSGREWQPKGQPEKVRVHDFIIPELGRANPYGVYDLTRNVGWVNVGTDHDTAAFAVESIRRWWEGMGKEAYPQATELLITADGGGSNGSRVRLWKLELQRLADDTGLRLRVCHFPPGTSKWNKIEHRLFSFISMNWRGKPLTSHEVMVELIAATTNRTGLKVHAAIDRTDYPAGTKVSAKQMKTLRLEKDAFHGEWNYSIVPHNY
jgi:Rhodopirellula transposase DDE domain